MPAVQLMNAPNHKFGMAWPNYEPPGIEGLLSYLESLPEPPRTHLPRLRRLLWFGADHCGRLYRLSCLLHNIGWRLP